MNKFVICFQEPTKNGSDFFMIRDYRQEFTNLDQAIAVAEQFATENPTKKVYTAKLVAVSGILNNVTTKRFK